MGWAGGGMEENVSHNSLCNGQGRVRIDVLKVFECLQPLYCDQLTSHCANL